jgi:PTH1 family peptidyl-tRNA hydrolase
LAFQRSGNARVAQGAVAGQSVILLKPETYMNRSGAALDALRAIDGLQLPRDLLVLVDDWAIPVGTFRLRARGSPGGHNGLKSIAAALGSRDYARLRIGVGPLPAEVADPADWVLDGMYEDEADAINDLLPTMVDAVECWVADGIELAMTKFNPLGGREG